jgi:phosphoesterase RecJ-like protein
MSDKKIPEKILEVIRDKGHCLVTTHVQPDGDAIGSLLAMADMLEQMGKRVFAYLDEPISHLYSFLPSSPALSTDIEQLRAFVDEAGVDICAIALDCGEADRMGRYQDIFLGISPLLVIDHHLSHQNFGDYRWVDPQRSSTGEMVYEISESLGQTPTYEGAFSLYVAICTDTGSFRYECTGARTFEIAGRLVALGVNPNHLANLIYDNYSPERLDLMQRVLATLELSENQQIACIYVTREMFERSRALTQDAEGFVEYARAIRSVKVAVFVKENKSEIISVSLRAKGEFNVASIAKKFGGGGHRNAAGCKFPADSIDSVREKVIGSIKAALRASSPDN